MGVVHKLKKEVFDFIINKKKEEPLISCRQLSEQTSKKFEIKVSKSSVNSVLKNTMLSSSVGRRVQKKATSKKFQIPPEKKQQLLDSISSLGFTFDKKVSAENEEQKKGVPNELLEIKKEAAVFSLEKLSIDLQEHERRKRKGKIFYDEQRVKNEERVFAEENKAIKEEQSALSSQYQKEYVVPVGPKFFDEEQFLYDVKIARENKGKERKNSNLYDNAGVVFLKAAQIDMSGENLLGDLFGKNSKGMGLENFNNICSSLLFLKAFNMQSVETIENSKNDALWRLNGFKGYPGRENLFGWTQKIDFSNQLQLEYLNEKEQALSKICAFNVIFEDSTSIVLDAQLRSLWRDLVQKELFASVSSAMTILSKTLISNNECLVMDVLREKGINKKDLSMLVAACFDIPGRKIRKIEVLSENQDIITEFTLIPSIKRSFIVGFRPYQEIFKELIQKFVDFVDFSYYDSQRDSILYYSEKNVPFSSFLNDVFNIPKHFNEEKSLKLVFLGKEKNKMPQIALLTNMFAEKAETIIANYLNRWPSAFKQSYNKEETSNAISKLEPIKSQHEDHVGDFVERRFENLGDIFDDYILTLHEYCLDKYFPKQKGAVDIKTMVPIFYGLKGFVQEHPNRLIVTIMIPERYNFLEVLEFAINRVNDRHLVTKEGKGFFVSAQKIKA